MRIDIGCSNFPLTEAIARHVEGRVALSLVAVPSQTLRGVMVRLRDTNGMRGGVDKACRIVVWLSGRRTVVVDAVDHDLYTAVDATAARLREAVNRQLRRRRSLRREYANRRPQRVFA